MLKKIILVASSLLLLTLFVPFVARAASFFAGFFPPLIFKHPGDPQRPGLWFINDGDFHNGSFQYYNHCGDSSCIDEDHDGDAWFLNTTMFPDSTPGNYVNMEASELQTGYAFGQGYEDTHPTQGHPVTVTARIRCSSCNQDGTGGQVGSWGLWLWNSYPEVQPDGSFVLNPISSIGFSWVEAGGIFPGLGLNAFRNNFPVYLSTLHPPMALDLTQWHTYSFTWEVNPGGLESVTYYIDGQRVGFTTIPGGMPALSSTFWHDNQMPTGLDANGNPVTVFRNPSVPQFVDVDFMSVTQ